MYKLNLCTCTQRNVCIAKVHISFFLGEGIPTQLLELNVHGEV